MIRLKNVGKTYVSKSKQRVDALRDVTLELGDRGMVFVLGKSGSGKSTLLNLLGGLDSPTSGEIEVEGVSFADFGRADYDAYRNRRVGFVFQDFNLLHDFDVRGNVTLALQLSEKVGSDDKVIDALAAVGLSAEYATRKIDELSGGEKQRVAIARAIIKNSPIILADEPTGNLDSATGESIWRIFKDLSKTKLVVVVSHDRESAETYGDRIVEIADGRIIDDRGKQPTETEERPPFAATKNNLPFKACCKMGVNTLLKRKGKAISVVLLSIVTVFALVLTQLVCTFSAEKSIAKFVRDNGVDYVVLTQGQLRFGNEFHFRYITVPSTERFIRENARCIRNGRIEKKSDIADLGLTFVGEALEIDDDSFYITSSCLEEIYRHRDSYVLIDGEKEKLVKEKHPPAFLVGKRINYPVTQGFSRADYVLAGVIDSDACSPLIRNNFPQYFSTADFPEVDYRSNLKNDDDKFPDVTLRFGDLQYTNEFLSRSLPEQAYALSQGKIWTADGLKEPSEVVLADNEIVLNYELYERLFSVSPKWSYISADLTQPLIKPPHIGQKFSLRFDEYRSGERLLDLGEVTIAGISFISEIDKYDEGTLFFVGRDAYRKICDELRPHSFLVQVASTKNFRSFATRFRNKHEGYVLYAGADESDDYASIIYSFEQNLWYFKLLFSSIAVALSVIFLLLVVNLIAYSIADRKKEIGILSALGVRNKDITKIFLIETAVISCLTFFVVLGGIIAASIVFNRLIYPFLLLRVPLLRVDVWTIVTLVAAAFGLPLILALLPLAKIIKLKPIDAIKNL